MDNGYNLLEVTSGDLMDSVVTVVNNWRRKWHPFQYYCLENPMDRGAWQAAIRGATEWDMTERLHSPMVNNTLLILEMC